MATEFYDVGDTPENAIEWLKGRKTATVTLAGRTSLNGRVRKLAKEKPDKCQIIDENEDGTIVAHLPAAWIKINPTRELTEEEHEKLAATARKNFSANRARSAFDEAETASKPKSRKTVRSKK